LLTVSTGAEGGGTGAWLPRALGTGALLGGTGVR